VGQKENGKIWVEAEGGGKGAIKKEGEGRERFEGEEGELEKHFS
jgi:hypothetical protein